MSTVVNISEVRLRRLSAAADAKAIEVAEATDPIAREFRLGELIALSMGAARLRAQLAGEPLNLIF